MQLPNRSDRSLTKDPNSLETMKLDDLDKGSPTPVVHHDEECPKVIEGSFIEENNEDVNKTIKKIDKIILPIMTVVLAFSYIDRSNISLAAVAGMSVELGFEGFQYSMVLLTYFIGYIIFVLPSNFILHRTRVRYWLTCLTFLFGVFTMATGLSQNFATIAAMRVFLGIAEAGVFPTVILAVSSWYPRYYAGRKLAVVQTGASLTSALSGVLSWALSRINTSQYAGWRWIFIVEGLITIATAAVVYAVVDEYPEKSRHLSEKQREVATRLINQDRVEHEEEIMTFRLVLKTLRDWRIWFFAFQYMFCVSTTYGMAYFMPLILHSRMGFDGAVSQLLTCPPYVYAFVLAVTFSRWSDRAKARSPFIIIFSLNVLMGICLVRWGPNTGAQYTGMFFTIGGALVNGPMIIIWAQNNAPTRNKRNISSGVQLMMGAVGGIIGSTVFRSQDAPEYTPGVIVVLSVTSMIIASTLSMALYLRHQNQQREATGGLIEGQENFRWTL